MSGLTVRKEVIVDSTARSTGVASIKGSGGEWVGEEDVDPFVDVGFDDCS